MSGTPKPHVLFKVSAFFCFVPGFATIIVLVCDGTISSAAGGWVGMGWAGGGGGLHPRSQTWGSIFCDRNGKHPFHQ